MEGLSVTPILTANPDSNITLAASFGEIDGDSDYVESRKN